MLFLIGTGRCFSGPAASAMMPMLVPKEDFVNAVTWGATIFQTANATRADGGRAAVYGDVCGAGAVARGAGGVRVYAGDAVRFMVLVGAIRVRAVSGEKKAFNAKTVLAGLKYVAETQAAAGVDLAGPVCGAAGRGGGADADLCARCAARGAARAGAAAGDAQPGRAGGEPDAGVQADQAAGGQADAGVRGGLRRGDGAVRAEPVACG